MTDYIDKKAKALTARYGEAATIASLQRVRDEQPDGIIRTRSIGGGCIEVLSIVNGSVLRCGWAVADGPIDAYCTELGATPRTT